ncbi:cation:dicarboxylate symporter family transporter [Xanthomonas citri]|uniref:cation:dicarboxylate symporter family transporter n=1 Tax=Xanthomonas citri TaxID=346 RepID=UPI0023687151|nr:cation:dicarboxylase symporter family transporter [Xanthomonas citri]
MFFCGDVRRGHGADRRRKGRHVAARHRGGVFEISMTLIGLVIRLAPYAVACFMFNLAALFGFDLLIRLGAYVGVVVLALGLHMVVSYGIAVKFAGRSPLSFFSARPRKRR